MLHLEDLKRGARITGIVPQEAVTVVDVHWIGATAVELTYKTPAGQVANQLLYRDSEPTLALVTAGVPWAFDSDGALFRLVSEAHRIRLAYLFDPWLALSTSLVEPLPHQITAVYEQMLPRHSLCTWMAPDSRRVMANKLLTRRLSRSASAWAVCRSSRRVGASSLTSSSKRVLVAPVMAVSGVRRSCETELSREFRSRSVSTWSCACCASSASRARSSARAVWLAKVSSNAPCSGVST